MFLFDIVVIDCSVGYAKMYRRVTISIKQIVWVLMHRMLIKVCGACSRMVELMMMQVVLHACSPMFDRQYQRGRSENALLWAIEAS